MDAATQTWLNELKASGSIPEEDMNVLLKIAANPKADEFIKGSVLRQADYSREIQKAKDLQTQLASKESDVTKFQGQLASWQSGAKASYEQALRDREEIAGKLTLAQERLRTLGTTHNIDETEWAPVVGTKVETKPKEEPKYMTQAEVDAQVRKSITESAMIDAAMHDLNVRHLELFGTPLKNGVAFVAEALRAEKTLTSYFDEKFKVAEKVNELAEKAVQKRIDDAVAVRDAALRSELNIATPRAGDRQSPLFESNFHPKQDGEGRTISAVQAAIDSYSSGKYQVKQPGA